MSLSSIVVSKGAEIVDDAIRISSHIGEMMGKGYHSQNASRFCHDVLQNIDSLGGIKLQASEKQNVRFLKQLNRIATDMPINLTAVMHATGTKQDKMRLADPYGTSINNYTFNVLSQFLIEYGSNLDQSSFSLNKYFPDTPTSALETMVDRGQGVYGRINAADYNSPLPIRNLMQTYNYKYEAVRFSEKLPIYSREMLYTREKGSQDFEGGVAGLQQIIAYNVLYENVRLLTGKNLDLADVILRNGMTYPVGSNTFISTGIPPQNTFVFPTPVGTYSLSTGQMIPNDGQDNMRILASMLAGYLPLIALNKNVREIILHPLIYQCFVQNQYFQTWQKQSYITDRTPTTQDILQFFTIPELGDIKFVCDSLSWNPLPSNQATNTFANNQYVIGGNSTTITNDTFKALISVDTSSQGGTMGGVLIAPDILAGSYINGAAGMGVRVFDMTEKNPELPHIMIVPFATYLPAIWGREMLFNIDFQVNIVA